MNGLLNSFEFGDDFAGRRDQLVLEMLYGTGIRLSELIGIHAHDVSLGAATVRVTGKGNKQRLVPLNPTLLRVLEGYQTSRAHEFGAAAGPLLLTDKGDAMYEKLS